MREWAQDQGLPARPRVMEWKRTDADGRARDSETKRAFLLYLFAQLAHSSTSLGKEYRDHGGAVCILKQAREEEAGMGIPPTLPGAGARTSPLFSQSLMTTKKATTVKRSFHTSRARTFPWKPTSCTTPSEPPRSERRSPVSS